MRLAGGESLDGGCSRRGPGYARSMYDSLRALYRFRCADGEHTAQVRLSGFRHLERLDGPAHPAVYRVTWSCPHCRQDHLGLVTQAELDVAPLEGPEQAFWDPLTGRVGGSLGHELAAAAADRLKRGSWPWSFWCSAERCMRPGYPSSLSWIDGRDHLVGVAVSCAACGETSLNLVSPRHLDEPFYHDPVVSAVDRPVREMAEIERFRHELWSGRFDGHRSDFAA